MNDDAMQIYIEKRLDHWAEWVLKGNWGCQGYPTKNILYDWIKMGCVLSSTKGKKAKGQLPLLPCDEEAEEIEHCIMEMHKQNPKIALALRLKYLSQGTTHQKSKSIHSSGTQFKAHVNMARQWLAGWFSARPSHSVKLLRT